MAVTGTRKYMYITANCNNVIDNCDLLQGMYCTCNPLVRRVSMNPVDVHFLKNSRKMQLYKVLTFYGGMPNFQFLAKNLCT